MLPFGGTEFSFVSVRQIAEFGGSFFELPDLFCVAMFRDPVVEGKVLKAVGDAGRIADPEDLEAQVCQFFA